MRSAREGNRQGEQEGEQTSKRQGEQNGTPEGEQHGTRQGKEESKSKGNGKRLDRSVHASPLMQRRRSCRVGCAPAGLTHS